MLFRSDETYSVEIPPLDEFIQLHRDGLAGRVRGTSIAHGYSTARDTDGPETDEASVTPPAAVDVDDTKLLASFRDLLKQMLCNDPNERLTINEVCEHPFLKTRIETLDPPEAEINASVHHTTFKDFESRILVQYAPRPDQTSLDEELQAMIRELKEQEAIQKRLEDSNPSRLPISKHRKKQIFPNDMSRTSPPSDVRRNASVRSANAAMPLMNTAMPPTRPISSAHTQRSITRGPERSHLQRRAPPPYPAPPQHPPLENTRFETSSSAMAVEAGFPAPPFGVGVSVPMPWQPLLPVQQQVAARGNGNAAAVASQQLSTPQSASRSLHAAQVLPHSDPPPGAAGAISRSLHDVQISRARFELVDVASGAFGMRPIFGNLPQMHATSGEVSGMCVYPPQLVVEDNASYYQFLVSINGDLFQCSQEYYVFLLQKAMEHVSFNASLYDAAIDNPAAPTYPSHVSATSPAASPHATLTGH